MKNKTHTLAKIFLIFTIVLLFGNIAEARSVLWSEQQKDSETSPASISKNDLREKNNAYIASLMNDSEKPLVQNKKVPETNKKSSLEVAIQRTKLEENFDIILFFGAGTCLFLLFIFIIFWLKNNSRGSL